MDPVDDASTANKRKRNIPPPSNDVSYQKLTLTSGESTTSNSSLVDDDEDGEESSLDVLTIAPFEQPRYSVQNVNMDRRPRAQTMPENSSFGRLDLDEYRSPMGHLTWLASVADEDFFAAKLLAELSTRATTELTNPWTSQSTDVWDSDNISSSSNRSKGMQSDEPARQRRRRANSVIEMPSATLRPVRQVLL